jgi:hypothetical protein
VVKSVAGDAPGSRCGKEDSGKLHLENRIQAAIYAVREGMAE